MNRRQVVALAAVWPLASAPVAAQDSDPVVTLITGWLAMFDSRDFSQIETLISPDYGSLYPSETSKQGRDALIERFQSDTAWDAFTARSSEPISIAVDGDLVHVLAEITVTTEDGVEAVIPWLLVLRVQNGLITAGTGTVDREYLTDLLGP